MVDRRHRNARHGRVPLPELNKSGLGSRRKRLTTRARPAAETCGIGTLLRALLTSTCETLAETSGTRLQTLAAGRYDGNSSDFYAAIPEAMDASNITDCSSLEQDLLCRNNDQCTSSRRCICCDYACKNRTCQDVLERKHFFSNPSMLRSSTMEITILSARTVFRCVHMSVFPSQHRSCVKQAATQCNAWAAWMTKHALK